MSWNGSNKSNQNVANKSVPKSKSIIPLLTISAICVVVAYFFFSSSDNSPSDKDTTKETRKIKDVSLEDKKDRKNPLPQTNKVVAVKKEMYLGKEVISHTFKTNSTGRSVREIIVTADGKKHGKTTIIAKPIFKYGTDQMLADALFPPEKGQSAPWPQMDAKAIDKEFAQSILDPIVISENDPEDVKIKKEAVIQARAEIIQLIKEGHSVLDIIRQQQEFNENAKEMRLTVAKELHNLRKEGASANEIKEYLKNANQLLEKQGIAPLEETQKKGR